MELVSKRFSIVVEKNDNDEKNSESGPKKPHDNDDDPLHIIVDKQNKISTAVIYSPVHLRLLVQKYYLKRLQNKIQDDWKIIF